MTKQVQVNTKENKHSGPLLKINNGVGTKTKEILVKVLSALLTILCRHQINRCRSPKGANSSSKVGASLILMLLILATTVAGVYENVNFGDWN